MTATELLDFLREFHKDKLSLLRRHEAAARHVSDYDFNNTYQYVIAREEMHVSWVRDAILDVSGQTNAAASGEAENPSSPTIQVTGRAPRRSAPSSPRTAMGRRPSSTSGGRGWPRSHTRATGQC